MEVASAPDRRKLMKVDHQIQITPKAFAKGSSCPPTTIGKMRLYNMRFCPYAERVVLVLEAKKVIHEVVNVNLTEKPEWYFEKHPEGKVPAIEIDDQVIAESLILCDYLDEAYPEPPLYPKDAFQKAKDRMLIARFSKVESKALAFLKFAYKDVDTDWEELQREMDFYEEELKNRDTKYFQGNKPGMIDYAIWPWFERFQCFPELHKIDPMSNKRFPTLLSWMKDMLAHPVVSKVAFPPETLAIYTKSWSNGATPNYDLSL